MQVVKKQQRSHKIVAGKTANQRIPKVTGGGRISIIRSIPAPCSSRIDSISC